MKLVLRQRWPPLNHQNRYGNIAHTIFSKLKTIEATYHGEV
jgi:hypothetical protein